MATLHWTKLALAGALAGLLTAGAEAAPYRSAVRRAPAKAAPPAAPAPPKLTPLYADPRQPDLTGIWLVTGYGTTTGKWEGDTLVVTTTNIREDTQLDFSGPPHSEALTITERFRRTGPDALEDQITLTDPKAFDKPFATTRVYRRHADWTLGE